MRWPSRTASSASVDRGGSGAGGGAGVRLVNSANTGARTEGLDKDVPGFLLAEHDDLARFFQRADDAHDLALSVLDVAQPHRAQVLDLLAEHCLGALGEVREDLLGHALGRG